MEALLKGEPLEKVLLQKGLGGENFQKLFQLIRQNKVPFQMVPAEKLNRVTRLNHQGVIAFGSLIEYQPLHALLPALFEGGETPLLVLLDGITDVRNLGALARSAECAGAHALVIPARGMAPVNAEAIKASSGALTSMPVCKESSIPESIAFLKECGLRVLACDEKGPQTIYQADLTAPLAIVMGAEDKGISPAVRKMADGIVSIPMKGRIGSLNVSVATGVVLFEAVRQRG
jgi:23S rRNA (guanosine2251-2'-O)-methyltransferase